MNQSHSFISVVGILIFWTQPTCMVEDESMTMFLLLLSVDRLPFSLLID